MAKKITTEDIYDVKAFDALLSVMEKIEVKMKNVISMSSQKVQSGGTGYEEMKKVTQAVVEATKAEKVLVEVQKEQIKVRAAKKSAIEAEEGSYNKIKAKYDQVKAALNAMGTETLKNSAAAKALIATSIALQKEMDDLKNVTGRSRAYLGVFKHTVDLATMSLGEMKKEMRALKQTSFTGKSEEEIKALKLRIGEVQDAMGDLSQEMKMMGTEKSAVMVAGLKFVAAGVEGVVGSLSMFGVEEKNIAKVQQKLTALIAVTHALSEIEDTITSGKLRAIGIRLKTMALDVKDTAQKWVSVVATNAQARAENAKMVMQGKASMATKAYAAVQWALNAAMAANPVVLLIAAFAALAVGIGVLVYKMTSLTEEQKKAKMEAEGLAKIEDSAIDKYTEKVTKMEELKAVIMSSTTNTHDYNEAIKELSKETGINISAIKDKSKQMLIAGEIIKEQIKLIKQQAEVEAARELYIEKRKEELRITKDINKSTTTFWQDAWNVVKSANNAISLSVATAKSTLSNYKENVKIAGEETDIFWRLLQKENAELTNEKNNMDLIVSKYGLKYLDQKDATIKKLKELNKQYGYLKDEAKMYEEWEAGRAKRESDAMDEYIKKNIDKITGIAKGKGITIDENQINIEFDNWKYSQDKITKLKMEYRAKYGEGFEQSKEYKDALWKLEHEGEEERRQKEIAALEDYIKKVEDKRQRAMDREIEQSKRHQDYLKELAARGSEDAKNNIAYEEARQRKLELQKEKALQRAKQTELMMAVLKSYSKNIESSGGNSTEALMKTIKDATLLTAFIKGLPAFKEGTEDTGEAAPNGGIDGRGGRLGIFHEKESVLNKEQTSAKKAMNLTNWGLIEAAQNNMSWQSNDQILKKFDELKQVIDSKPVYLGSDYDNMAHSINQIIENGNSLIRNHKRLSRL